MYVSVIGRRRCAGYWEIHIGLTESVCCYGTRPFSGCSLNLSTPDEYWYDAVEIASVQNQ